MNLAGEDCVALVEAMRRIIKANLDRLSRLDSDLGDGDHGVNLLAALDLACGMLPDLENPAPADVFQAVGATLINQMGGAAGIVFGSFFRGGGRSIHGHARMGLAETRQFLHGGLAAVQKRGKARPGDKTLVDALEPAAAAAAAALEDGLEMGPAMAAVAAAAAAGAVHTTEMVAQVGRAKFLGQRSLGHQDPGATSMALLLEAWAAFVEEPLS